MRNTSLNWVFMKSRWRTKRWYQWWWRNLWRYSAIKAKLIAVAGGGGGAAYDQWKRWRWWRSSGCW